MQQYCQKKCDFSLYNLMKSMLKKISLRTTRPQNPLLSSKKIFEWFSHETSEPIGFHKDSAQTVSEQSLLN